MTSPPLSPVPAPSWRAQIQEFLGALANPFTYSPLQNPESVFGFIWGVPVPIVVFGVYIHATGMPFNVESVSTILKAEPLAVFFLLHPILFAIVFGAHGTMRSHRDAHILHLLESVEKQNKELQENNTRLAEVDRLKTEFLANVTHELKSPLVTAIGYNDRMLGGHLGAVTDRQRNALEVAKRNLTRLRNLISEIMDFSRLEAGVVQFDMKPVRLDALVTSAIENLALKASDKHVSISSELPEGGATVQGDSQKLLQVIVNLLDNAIKFSPERGKIRAAITDQGPRWRLDIADEGCGIPAESIPKLFERFKQVDGSRGRNFEGVGLGLVVVKKIIEGHGGKVWIESRVGAGTTLHVELVKS